MKIIDLTLPLHNEMPVYPGDPEPNIEQIQFYENGGWNMRRIEINSHDGTHVNVPIHATKNGNDLDDYSLDNFMGEAVLFESMDDIQSNVGVIFHDQDITTEIENIIIERRPKFVGLSDHFEFNVDIERRLLEQNILSYERLTNTALLPKKFLFYGLPLRIEKGDGSPVRACAIIE